MATATKRAMATDGDNTSNGYRKESGGHLTAETMGMAQRTRPAAHATTGERGMMVAMGPGLCVCFGVCGETTKNKEESKIVMVPWSL
jgi:hypothetical protein